MKNTINPIEYFWIDDIREIPADIKEIPSCHKFHITSVWEFIRIFRFIDGMKIVIDLDHDAGDYERYGGDYYNILKWMEYYYSSCYEDCEKVKNNITFKFHTANPVGRQNMINICERNGWKYD